ncbi:MAG: hypothetical protein J6T99_06260 [Oscillospiraceae bacterium]|nr:hypothetical protein [Oscillospiraceae bacterium]
MSTNLHYFGNSLYQSIDHDSGPNSASSDFSTTTNVFCNFFASLTFTSFYRTCNIVRKGINKDVINGYVFNTTLVLIVSVNRIT